MSLKILPDKHLHIISFDVPWPANYGGVIDVFYKIKALFLSGWKIHLHSFEYGRAQAPELKNFCEKITYYPRNISKSGLFQKLPYIVCSRNNNKLLENLSVDDSPILFEGLHTTFLLSEGHLKNRNIIVRMHNVEHEYYQHLAKDEQNPFRKFYFKNESKKLLLYESVLKNANHIAAISPNDYNHFLKHFNNDVFYLPAFHPYDKLNCETGLGEYALYHGNLAVSENNKAAMFLVTEVFSKLKIPLIIAGNNPKPVLKNAIAKFPTVSLIANPDQLLMEKLIREAQINILPTFQSTGIKLKLLAALYNGRHLLVNEKMIEGNGLDEICNLANDPTSFQEMTKQLMKKPFTTEMINDRKAILEKLFSNSTNIKLLENKINNSEGFNLH